MATENYDGEEISESSRDDRFHEVLGRLWHGGEREAAEELMSAWDRIDEREENERSKKSNKSSPEKG